MMKMLGKIRTIKVLLLLMVVAMTFAGCGKKPKDEAELQQDFLNSNYIGISEESEITDFEIIKRLTEKENRKDTVYVSMKIENEFFYETAAYVMYYTEYNDGWSLDNIEAYFGNDFEYKAVPLKAPSHEMILDEARWNSDAIIESFNYENESFYQKLGLYNLYFFEEGTYTYEIINEKLDLENGNYSCKLVVDREFELVTVHEVSDVVMCFEGSSHDLFGWFLAEIEISEISYDWDIEGTWAHPDEEYPIVITEYNNNSEEPYVNVEFMDKDVITTFGEEIYTLEENFSLKSVSSQNINPTYIDPGEPAGQNGSPFSPFRLFESFIITPNAILDGSYNSEVWVRVE